MAKRNGSWRTCSYSAGVSSINRPQSAEPHSHTKPTSVVSSPASLPRSMSSLIRRKVASLRAIRSFISADTRDSLLRVPTDGSDGQQREVVAQLPAAEHEGLVLDGFHDPGQRAPGRGQQRVAQDAVAAEAILAAQLGGAVGVEDQRVARRQPHGGRAERRLGRDAEQYPGSLELLQ